MKLFSKFLLISLSVFALWSCNKDEDQIPDPEPPAIAAPAISNFGVWAADTTITMGGNIAFAPKITPTEPAITYSWKIDGKEIASTATYTFSPEQTGVYNIEYSATNESGTAKKSVVITVKLHKGGFYIVNEGWFGHENGSVNYFDTEKKELITNIYKNNNTNLELGVTTTFGTEWHGNYYFVSKQGRRLVSANAMSFKDNSSLLQLGGDGRSFAGVTSTTGVVTTGDGAFRVSLNPLGVGDILESTDGEQCGGVYATDSHVFVINSRKGILVYSVADNYKLVKDYGKGSVGFAKAKDGSLWAAEDNQLLKINTTTLEMTEVELPAGVKISDSWGAWNAGSLCASATENCLFFTKSGMWGGGREIYRYVIGDAGSLANIFAKSTVQDDAFYGAGINVDPVSGDIVATFVKDGWGDSYKDNRLVIFDGKTGAEKLRFNHEGFWFPSMIIFNK